MTAPDTGDGGSSRRYTSDQLDGIASAIESAADVDAEFDPAPELTEWAAKRRDPLGDSTSRIDQIRRDRADERSGRPVGDHPVAAARRARQDRRRP